MADTERLDREHRLVAIICAVAGGSVMRKNMPSRFDLEQAAAEIIAFAEEIEAQAAKRLSS